MISSFRDQASNERLSLVYGAANLVISVSAYMVGGPWVCMGVIALLCRSHAMYLYLMRGVVSVYSVLLNLKIQPPKPTKRKLPEVDKIMESISAQLDQLDTEEDKEEKPKV